MEKLEYSTLASEGSRIQLAAELEENPARRD